MHVFAIAQSPAGATSQGPVLRSACPLLSARAGTCQGEPATAHMFDYSDEELSAIVEWLSLEREGL